MAWLGSPEKSGRLAARGGLPEDGSKLLRSAHERFLTRFRLGSVFIIPHQRVVGALLLTVRQCGFVMGGMAAGKDFDLHVAATGRALPQVDDFAQMSARVVTDQRPLGHHAEFSRGRLLPV